jgi:WD40 repeat protein
VHDVAIAVKAGMAMGAYGSGGLWLWSFGDERPGSDQSKNSPASADALSRPRATGEALILSNHSKSIYSIAFSGDGKLAASCSNEEKFVLVWDTATGTVLRKLVINEARPIRSQKVAMSSNGDWILCAGARARSGKNAFLNLWGPSNQEFSTRFRGHNKVFGSLTMKTTSQDRPHGTILCGMEKDGYETYEWILSGSPDREIIVTPTAASDDDVAELKQTEQCSRELLFQQMSRSKLHVRNAALDRVARCKCMAAAMFDSEITCMSAWSETTSQPDGRASTSPKVAVGLFDGTVHFMKLHWNHV